jgi:uridine phosphorylase
MGKWAKSLFGRSTFNDVGIVVAGTNKPAVEKQILSLFDEVVSSKDSVYHGHLVKHKGKYYPVVSNVYGAPAMVDTLSEMHDGGCRTVIFVGYAYGFKSLDVGTIVIPNRSYHFEGIYHPIEPDRTVSAPDKELRKKLEGLLTKGKVDYVNGTNISVPAVTFQLPHANKEYRKIDPTTVEMELASCLSRAKDMGIRAVGVLIVSDNRDSSIDDGDKRNLRHESKITVLQEVVDNLSKLKFPRLKVRKEFNIDEHLAYIIDDPDYEENVYKRKK